MFAILIEIISTSLLIGAALLLYLWKEQDKTVNHFIRRISFCLSFIGVYKLSNIIFSLSGIEAFSALNKVFSLAGFMILMFSLLNYLEGKK